MRWQWQKQRLLWMNTGRGWNGSGGDPPGHHRPGGGGGPGAPWPCSVKAMFTGRGAGDRQTMLVRALAGSLSLSFARIQFTPDLMPADILGTSIVMQNSKGGFDLQFEKGPVFAHLVLADEINQASPKTQAALLEAMQERTVTIRGENHPLPSPSRSWPPKTPWRWRVLTPCPKPRWTGSSLRFWWLHPSEAELWRLSRALPGRRRLPAVRS